MWSFNFYLLHLYILDPMLHYIKKLFILLNIFFFFYNGNTVFYFSPLLVKSLDHASQIQKKRFNLLHYRHNTLTNFKGRHLNQHEWHEWGQHMAKLQQAQTGVWMKCGLKAQVQNTRYKPVQFPWQVYSTASAPLFKRLLLQWCFFFLKVTKEKNNNIIKDKVLLKQ